MATDLRTIPLSRIDGTPASLADHAGQVLLVVNVASKCGLTPQYEALEALHRRFRERGFAVLGFPSNDFMGQEPGTEAEIAAFCSTRFDVSFPMFGKLSVKGPAQHPLYRALTEARPRPEGTAAPSLMGGLLRLTGVGADSAAGVSWNFEKFLLGRDGRVRARFAPRTAPDAPEVVRAIEEALEDGE